MFEFTIRENDFLNGFLDLLSEYVNKSYKFTMSYLTSPLLSDVRESERLVLLVVNKSVFQNMYSFIKLNDSNMQFASFSCLETAVNSMRLYNVLAINPDYMHEYITGGNFSLEVCENEISEKQKEYKKGEEEFSLREFATGLGKFNSFELKMPLLRHSLLTATSISDFPAAMNSERICRMKSERV